MRCQSFALVLLLGTFSAACAGAPSGEETDGSDSALSGSVKAGTVTKTTTDGLRLRKAPDKTDDANIIGLIPVGTQVKIVTGTPTNGFYKLQVMDAAVKKALLVDTGWVYGDYLQGKAQEPAVPSDPDQSLTGTHDVPTVAKVKWVPSDCKSLKDDKGKPMAPSADDVLLGNGTFGVIGIDTNTFSYGSSASIDELDAASMFNPGGTKIPLKIVKTAKTQPDGPFTVTICMNDASRQLLPVGADGLLTLSVK